MITRRFIGYNNIKNCIKYTKFYSCFSTNDTDPKRKIHQFEFLREEILSFNKINFSKEYFNELLNKVSLYKGNINANNFEALFLEAAIDCNSFEVGNTFFKYLISSQYTLNLAIIGKYFKFCFHFKHLCTETEKKLLIKIYKETLSNYSYFDFSTYENLVLGLSITDLWKEALDILNKAKEYYEPTSKMYSAAIAAAFLNSCESIGHKLLEEMVCAELKPHMCVYDSWISGSDSRNNLSKILIFLETQNLKVPIEFSDVLVKQFGGEITTVKRGACMKCGYTLPQIKLSNEEFELLRDVFLKPVLIGNDIYLKSQPSEFESFKLFIQKSGPVDVVLDGLNIAYSNGKKNSPTHIYAKTLKNVVKYFNDKSYRVMVLGRQHMKKWPKMIMSYIYNNSNFFFVDDLSQDDPLILYAAMKSGMDTKFVSRDLMRSHKFLLKDLTSKRVFSKWQQKNQLFLGYFEKDGTVILKNHVLYGLYCQQSANGSWHVPIYEPIQPGMPPNIHNANLKWVCLPAITTNKT